MLFKEEFIVEAPYHEAWKFFSNFPDPIKVLPGLTELYETAPHQFTGSARVGIGPFSFQFKGHLNIIMVDAKTGRVNISGGAQDHLLGAHFTATAYTKTVPHTKNSSRVMLEVEVAMGGLLDKLGTFILKPAARRITQHYSRLVNQELKRQALMSVNPALEVSVK